jgi:RNA polymerase sigma-70 factor (ECF subfamily)
VRFGRGASVAGSGCYVLRVLLAHPTCLSVEGSIGCVTDEELVLLARQGDTGAFDELVIRHQAAVYRAALAALRVPEDAEDVAQEAFARAWSTLERFRGEASFKTWLLTIAWHRAINRRRMRMNWLRRTAPLTGSLVLVASSGAPDEDLRSGELRAQIGRAIEMLTPKLRDALLLARSGEYSYEEIGTMLRIPEGTVKWRVSEARRKVKQRLAELGYVHED